MNYSIFLPIQLYQFISDDNKRLYRLEPPSIQFSTPTSFNFLEHFIYGVDNITEYDIDYLKSKWIYQTTIWAINPIYFYYFTNGYSNMRFVQNYKYPYNTSQTLKYRNVNEQKKDIKVFKIIFPNYQLPHTSLLCIIYKLNSIQMIDDIIIVNEKYENDGYNDKYNFLPFKKNKNIPFYNLKNNRFNSFIYIYMEKPKGYYWKPNYNNICYPTTDENAYLTSFDCFNNSIVSEKPFKNIYLQDNMKTLNEVISNQNNSNNSFYYIIFIILILLFICSIIFLSIYKIKYNP